jgi:hypothetical protein
MKGNITLKTLLAYSDILVVVLGLIISYIAYKFTRHLFSTRSIAAITGVMYGIWSVSKLITYSYDKAWYIFIAFIIALPIVIYYIDRFNTILPQIEPIKSIVSFVEGALLGAILITVISNLFPVN